LYVTEKHTHAHAHWTKKKQVKQLNNKLANEDKRTKENSKLEKI